MGKYINIIHNINRSKIEKLISTDAIKPWDRFQHLCDINIQEKKNRIILLLHEYVYM